MTLNPYLNVMKIEATSQLIDKFNSCLREQFFASKDFGQITIAALRF